MFHPRSNIRVFIAMALTLSSLSFAGGFDPNNLTPQQLQQLQAAAAAAGLLGPHGVAGGIGGVGGGYGRPVDNSNFGITYQTPLRIQNFCIQNNIQNLCPAIDASVANLNTIPDAASFERPYQDFLQNLRNRGVKLPNDRQAVMESLCIKPPFLNGNNPNDPKATPAAGAANAKDPANTGAPDLVEAPAGVAPSDDVVSAVRRRILESLDSAGAVVKAIWAASDIAPPRTDWLKALVQAQPGSSDAVPPTPPRRLPDYEATLNDCERIPLQGNNFQGNTPFDSEQDLNLDRPSGDSQGPNNESGSPQGGGGGGGGYQKNSKKLEDVKIGEPKPASPFAPPGPVNEGCMFCAKIEEAGRTKGRYDNAAVGQIERDAALFSENIQKGMVPLSMPNRAPVSLPTTRDAINSRTGRSNVFGPAMNATSKK